MRADNSRMANTLASCDQSRTNMADIGKSPLPGPIRPSQDLKPRERRTYSTEDLLLKEVQPRLKSGIAQSIPKIGTDDPGELLQDGIVIVFQILNSAEGAG